MGGIATKFVAGSYVGSPEELWANLSEEELQLYYDSLEGLVSGIAVRV
jgi:hypothetical protein